ncbi:MAG: cysteine desulfurase [Clostridia bacterium]|nr:cysteine desulfurase [Clostridia bacterium]
MQAYLDNSATTRVADGVIQEMTRAMSQMYYNPSAMYREALYAEKEMNECRDLILKSIHAKDARVIFTSGGTESNNLALLGAAGAMHPPIRVLVSSGEHPSVMEAAGSLVKAGAEVEYIPLTNAGEIDYGALEAMLERDVNLISVMHVNNETGAINDIARISGMVRGKCPGARIHVDGVQGFLREKIDFSLIDMYTLSAHKIHGPKGVGALAVRKGVRLIPLHIGGGQEDNLRSGTENTPGIAGLKRAVLEMDAMTDICERLHEKKRRLYDAIVSRIPGAVVNGPEIERGACHILNMSFPGVRGEVMLHALEEEGVMVSTGSACSSKKRRISPVLTAMGVPSKIAECAVRFSLSPYTANEEIDYAAEKIKMKYEILKRFQRR